MALGSAGFWRSHELPALMADRAPTRNIHPQSIFRFVCTGPLTTVNSASMIFGGF
jgi:hypothetical protein